MSSHYREPVSSDGTASVCDSGHMEVPAPGSGVGLFDVYDALKSWGEDELADRFCWVLMNVEQS